MKCLLQSIALGLLCGFFCGCVLGEDTPETAPNPDTVDPAMKDTSSDVTSLSFDIATDGVVPADGKAVDMDGFSPVDIVGSDVPLDAEGDSLEDNWIAADCSGPSSCLSDGPCGEVHVAQCVDGNWVCDYSGVLGFNEGVETLCDGIDNNCDGQVDETFGVGIPCDGPDTDMCPNGQRVCSSDGLGWACSPETETDLVEICDEVDNNCDGDVDEGFGEKNAPCDDNGDGCATGLLLCAGPEGGLVCVGDQPCAQPNPNCLPAAKPFDQDVCGCVPGLFCDPVTASGCKTSKCQCGFLGAACAEGYICEAGACNEL